MNVEWIPQRNTRQLSVRIVSAFLFWYLAIWATLTAITISSQVLHITFRTYFRLSLIVVALMVGAGIFLTVRSLARANVTKDQNDSIILVGLVVAAIAVAILALSYHTKGRLFLDDFYLTANPVYYTEHAQAPMSFESRTFYSGGAPVISVGFVTAGAYENILAIPSYLLKVSYLITYYRLAAVFNSLLLVLSIYFALTHFSDGTAGALAGTLVVLCLLIAMSENSWAMGGLAFVHGYEGKAVLILIGIPLLAAYSLELLGEPARRTWLQMFLLVTAMTGMSTSSFMILPLLGAILFVACMVTFREAYPSFSSWLRAGLLYLSTYSFLIGFASLVSLVDKPANALLFNTSYPGDFFGYLRAFLASATWPATTIIAILSWTLALLVLRGRRRTFAFIWLALSLLLVLNPFSAQLLLQIFRGIYFRLFYLVFHPLIAGVVAASLVGSEIVLQGARGRRTALAAILCVALAPALFSRTSMLLSPRYLYGNWTPTDDYTAAQKIVAITPEGLMLAPYPLSGAVRMMSSNDPQLVARDDILSIYLGFQGRAAEAKLRLDANEFLLGNTANFPAFAAVLDRYPETRSIVFSKIGLAWVHSPALEAFLTSRGFSHHEAVEKYIVYWRW